MTPAQIMIACVKKVDARLKGVGRPRVLHDRKQATQLRADLFQLEGWARLHRNWPHESERRVFQKLRDRSKELEDALGALDTANTLMDEASKLEIPKMVSGMANEVHACEKRLKKILRSRDWLTKSGRTRTEKILAKLGDVEWLSDRAHFDYVRSEIAREIQTYRRRFDVEIRPVLKKRVYTVENVENDLHEWRRQLRWYAIYLQASRGLFALGSTPSKPSQPEARLMNEMANNPFAKLPKKPGTKVKLDPVAYLEITRLIDKIGRLKEEAELFFYIRERLVRSGAAKSEKDADRIARRLYGNVPEETPRQVRPLLGELDRFHPLLRLRRSLN